MGIDTMKPSMKVGVVALVGVCVILYQYHLSLGVRFDQLADQLSSFDSAAVSYGIANIPDAEDAGDADNDHNKITVEKIRAAVQSVQIEHGLSPQIGNVLVQELTSILSKTGAPTQVRNTEESTKHPSRISETTTVNLASTRELPSQRSNSLLKPLYIITPTYRRPEQIPELTRMSHTLLLIENVHWLVIEDAKTPTKEVTKFLTRTGLKFEHLTAPMPVKYKQKKGAKPRGVSNRNRGLKWIRANATDGVFYFADDDNTYDLDLFDEIRETKKVSMFPVGLCTKFGLSSPVVKDGKFIGFYDGWVAGRKFPVDMAGFAVNVKFLLQRPNATMPYRAGFEEDGFLRSLAPFEPHEIELLADNCTRILAWHTQTKKNEPSAPLDMKLYRSTNLVDLKQQIV
ncbi:galactosylgalactosylxylosylprotein 3-beta-glucuronosyltransferase P [Chelonus insularis]|uniref:galactosylgalactosylxylosylprotein 3-beta-glucuronosyltransferase P n=1 Tax=Chelonus insularis TaxID=460826 RepID=UPI00158E9067|nr:galactosylgalactosylxylosylprotein 3-beta-glucuronosyltransferase P [Chelonus insularis]